MLVESEDDVLSGERQADVSAALEWLFFGRFDRSASHTSFNPIACVNCAYNMLTV